MHTVNSVFIQSLWVPEMLAKIKALAVALVGLIVFGVGHVETNGGGITCMTVTLYNIMYTWYTV